MNDRRDSIHENVGYFPYVLPHSAAAWQELGLGEIHAEFKTREGLPRSIFYRRLAERLNYRQTTPGHTVSAGWLQLFALLNRCLYLLLSRHWHQPLLLGLADSGSSGHATPVTQVTSAFVQLYPGRAVIDGHVACADYLADDPDCSRLHDVLKELVLLGLASENRALDDCRVLFDSRDLLRSGPYLRLQEFLEQRLDELPAAGADAGSLLELLRAPLRAAPDSLAGQLDYIRKRWQHILPAEVLGDMVLAFDHLREEERHWWSGPGRPQVLEFSGTGHAEGGGDYPEYEQFSPDADWMSNVVLMAKMTYVWLDQLSKRHGRPINRLDHIPDEELDRLAGWGFTGLWLIGVWERSPASQRIKHLAGNHDAVSSAYSLYDYSIAADLGGEPAMEDLRRRAWQRGIRLASDMVPNHTGLYSRWVLEHPDWFIGQDYPPYPSYRFQGSDLSYTPDVSVQIEDGYWDHSDAAVVFRHTDHRSGRIRYIYHGNDGTSMPWNDTAQLNYLLPEVREAVIQTILHVARQFPIIRFDAAMTLAKKHFQRLWFPQPGHGGGVPSRADHAMTRAEFDQVFPQEFWREVVDRVAREAPGTLLLAEAFWLMEGYFVRTLGMHRVYNSAFMNMLKMEENAKYRQTIRNVLEFEPEILKRFVNFMNNPDEKTAIEQFGREGKYFGAALLLITMPGLPMFGHGQVEGFTEKYGMEYRRAYWDEQPDQHLVELHERQLFPLLRQRQLFSGSEQFALYDFETAEGVDENVFAYSNRCAGERGLIVYHNRFATTSGRIRTAVPRRVAGELVSQNLGQALNLRDDPGCYYTFRDYASGLDHLRSGAELCHQGLTVELGAYGYYAFLDFHEVQDEQSSWWRQLDAELAGRPVRSMAEEMKRLRFAGLREALYDSLAELMQLLSLTTEQAAASSHPRQGGARVRGAHQFLQHLGQEQGLVLVTAELQQQLNADLAVLSKILSAAAGERVQRDVPAVLGLLQGSEMFRPILAGYLLLRGVERCQGDGAAAVVTLFERFGLLGAMIEALSQQAIESAPDVTVQLMLLMLEHRRLLAAVETTEVEKVCAGRLMADARVRHFLLVNQHNGIDWFNRERFEELCRWLYLVALLDSTAGLRGGSGMGRQLVSIYRSMAALVEMAERSDYRLDRFLAMAVQT